MLLTFLLTCLYKLKKLIAIFLFTFFVFNLVGYKWLFEALEDKAEKRLELMLVDETYDTSQLIVFRKPVDLPYYYNSRVFSPATGEVEWNGKFYRFVKSRIVHDSIEMHCYPFEEKNRLVKAENDFVEMNTGMAPTGKTDKEKLPLSHLILKKILCEYDQATPEMFKTIMIPLPKIAFSYYDVPIKECTRDIIPIPPELM